MRESHAKGAGLSCQCHVASRFRRERSKESGAEVFNCFVNVASFPKTKLFASIDRESGAVILSGAPSLETQSEILKRICQVMKSSKEWIPFFRSNRSELLEVPCHCDSNGTF